MNEDPPKDERNKKFCSDKQTPGERQLLQQGR